VEFGHRFWTKPARITGSEIHFIRTYLKMTLADFGARFSVSHPAVKKWEKTADQATAMKWSVEKDIRLFILDRLAVNASAIGKLYRELGTEAKGPSKPIKLDLAA
jgi:transcriptional regulator with XRE-family HTH domain